MEMDSKKYWKTFLQTDDRYKGLVWKLEFNLNEYVCLKKISLGDIESPPNLNTEAGNISSFEIPNFQNTKFIRVTMDGNFDKDNDSRISLGINKLDSNVYYFHELYAIHFSDTTLGLNQTGSYNFKIDPLPIKSEQEITLTIRTNKKPIILKNICIEFMQEKLFP